MAVFALRDLTLILDYSQFAATDDTGGPKHLVLCALDDLDLEAAAGTFRTAMPSLEEVVIRRRRDELHAV